MMRVEKGHKIKIMSDVLLEHSSGSRGTLPCIFAISIFLNQEQKKYKNDDSLSF